MTSPVQANRRMRAQNVCQSYKLSLYGILRRLCTCVEIIILYCLPYAICNHLAIAELQSCLNLVNPLHHNWMI